MLRSFNKFIKSKTLGYVRWNSNANVVEETQKLTVKDDLLQQVMSSANYGQPTYLSHPHLLQPTEIVCGIKLSEIVVRRNKLIEIITHFTHKHEESEQNHLIIIPSAIKKYMSDKIPYTFRQNTDFLYLTGCQEPDCCLVLTVINGVADRMILFLRPKDKHAELWEGPRTGVDCAPNFFGIQEAKPIPELTDFLNSYAKAVRSFGIWYDQSQCDNFPVEQIMKEFIKQSGVAAVNSPTVFVHKLRVIKSKNEIKLMRESCKIASLAVNNTMFSSTPGMSEQLLYAKIDSYCRELGAQRLAYPPVIAGGARANIIHYIDNNQIINHGDMVLMDAGCEYNAFSSDITRTWPVSGTFTEPQRILYHIILSVQNDLIKNMMKEGYPSLDTLFQRMCLLLGTALQKLGIIDQTVPEKKLAQIGYSFCPHHVSHYLGMDVHDTPSISRSIPLQPGMIITIEPGVYIPVDRRDVPEEYRGLAVRIEDDLLITDNTPEILTDTCLKKIEDIENFLKTRETPQCVKT